MSAVATGEAAAAAESAAPSNVSLGFVLYQNDRFFRSRRFQRQRTTIRVLSGTVQGPLMPKDVEMIFRPQVRETKAMFFHFRLEWPVIFL